MFLFDCFPLIVYNHGGEDGREIHQSPRKRTIKVSRFWRLLLISLVIVLVLYGIYFALGRPVIPLPSIPYKVSPGQPLHSIITSNGADQLKLTLNTAGDIEIVSGQQSVVSLNYTPETFENTLDLGERLLIARKIVQSDGDGSRSSPFLRKVINWVIAYYYHVIRFRLSVLLIALP